jgi:bifunctional non-homologous end joining protein LigD
MKTITPTVISRRKRRRTPADPLPTALAPMLAVPADRLPPDPSHYTFEIKWDGVRAIAFWDGRGAPLRLSSRNQLDITVAYPELRTLADALAGHSAVLDGEVVAMNDAGQPSFARLQKRIHVRDPRAVARLAVEVPVFYVLFDLLYLDGRSLLREPYARRRELLEGLALAGPNWQVTPARVGEGAAMLAAARQNNLEGIVAKRLDSAYEPGRRSPAWLKIKVVQRQEFVVGGWLPQRGGADGRVGSLLLGYYDCRGGPLHFAGAVGTGFSDATHAALVPVLRRHARPDSPFAEPIAGKAGARFIEPRLVAEVEYRRWPEGGLVQHAAFLGLRRDKDPRQVVRERVAPAPTEAS